MIKTVDRLSYALSLLSGLAICCIVVLIVAEIFLRKFAGISLHFVWEYSVFIHISAVFLGAGWTLRTGGHIRVTLLRGLIPRAFEWISGLIGLAIALFLTSAMTQLALGYLWSGRTTGTTTDTPLIIPAAFVVFGCGVLTLQIALRLLALLLGKELELDTTGEDDPAPIMD
ncbi:TRAP transporter small permease [Alloyangia pacifica]|uniref:TRAP transporter small permease protein n=1 Tax=Alloyangia pacifica TaxID=311180 RepID=A0A1I6VHW3_9RHOB|nr:TRAP transporter small permease [Alloyangia pacifica]SDH98720.1 TRAP-type C4-dicarboxylate transport system, small permease component [Alloyangia pacifica]SFT13247.1 TRAP-type C4-dicarboxylate transport system, small permease component [Alloyangia pacifica]